MNKSDNPMGTQPLSKLLFSLAVPAVIANLVNSLYNIVDQIFILGFHWQLRERHGQR